MKKKDLKSLNSVAELVEQCQAFKRDLFVLRLNAATAHIKDYSQFKKLRKNTARALTYARQKMREDMLKFILENKG